MRYSVIKNINGAFTVDSEFSKLDKAKVKFHDVCKNLWNAKDVIKATVCIFDENMDIVEMYKEYITHEVEPTEEA